MQLICYTSSSPKWPACVTLYSTAVPSVHTHTQHIIINTFLMQTVRGEDFDAYTYQAREIVDILELFIQMKIRENRIIAPEKPVDFSTVR